MMQELAIGLAGGNLNTDQTPSFVRAVAKVDRSVVIGTVTVSPPYFLATGTETRGLWYAPLTYYPCDMDLR